MDRDAGMTVTQEIHEFRTKLRRWFDQENATLDTWRGGNYTSMEQELDHGAALVRMLHEAGWGRYGWPTEVGGLGGSAVLRAVLIDELWAHRIEMPYQYQRLEVMGPTLAAVRPDLAAEFIPPCLRGEEWWVQALSEPEAGSDIASLRTRAHRSGGEPDADFVLNGQKIWGSHGHTSSRAMVLCRTGTPESRHRGLTMLFVDLDQPGVTVRPVALASGRNHVSEMFFDDVRVPADRLLGEVNGGWQVLMRVMQYERGTYVWQRQAKLRHKLAVATRTVTERGAQAAEQVGAAYLAVLAARAQSSTTVHRVATGERLGPETSVDKILLGTAEHAVLDLVRELNPRGFLVDDAIPWDQFRDDWWYSRATTIFGGAAEVQRDLVADRVLRLPTEAP